jgi:hypothetical protein
MIALGVLVSIAAVAALRVAWGRRGFTTARFAWS